MPEINVATKKLYQVQSRGHYCKSYKDKKGAAFNTSNAAWGHIERMKKLYPRKHFRVVEKFNPYDPSLK